MGKKSFVLAPEIYVAGSLSLGGPAAALFNAYVGMRDEVSFVVSAWVQSELTQLLQSHRLDAARAAEQASFVCSLCKMSDFQAADGDDPLAGLAKANGLDTVYCVGERAGTEADGVRFVAVSELLAELGVAS